METLSPLWRDILSASIEMGFNHDSHYRGLSFTELFDYVVNHQRLIVMVFGGVAI
jgi:hypothetical protein